MSKAVRETRMAIERGPKLKGDHLEVLALARDPQYKNKPLSIAVRTGRSWRYVVQLLAKHHALDNEEAFQTGAAYEGLTENMVKA